MTLARASLTLAFALALAGCSPLVGATIDEPRICLLMQSQTIPAAPALPAGVVMPDQQVTWQGDLDLNSVLPGLDKPGAITGAIHVLSLTATATPATTDLSPITYASAAVVDGAGTPTVFMHYDRPSPVTKPYEIDLALDQDLNLLDQLQGGVLHYQITFKGQPPSNAWTADIETCFKAHLTLDALKVM
ncbi:hypothetical protein [Anaeromyxobacter diazotrophicus]|uniref:Lipoprotein n=1 Tax=Anaeromyxobacter diazotrophicus TaxID=2590199 RepID=A0A7I9VIT4_9BACT|nr:hypothetical protein [Anaeromyxobacter diazotrophicus]GEJ56050.1 hypothetical protein AMYX_07910 [Anaeromyxobacter diazotrophicus]